MIVGSEHTELQGYLRLRWDVWPRQEPVVSIAVSIDRRKPDTGFSDCDQVDFVGIERTKSIAGEQRNAHSTT